MRAPLPERTKEEAKPRWDLRDFYFTLREKFWVILLAVVAAGFLTTAHVMRSPKIYAANVLLRVEQEEQKVVKIEKLQPEDFRSLDVLRTIEQTIASRTVLESVAEKNNLATDPAFVGIGGPPPTQEQLISALDGMITVKLRRGTRLIDVVVQHPNPQLTEKIANSLVREFVRLNYEQQTNASRWADVFLLEEGRKLKLKLQESEKAQQKYREDTKSVSLEERQNIVVQRLKELAQQVTEAKSARIKLEAEYAEVQAVGTNTQDFLAVPSVANDPSVKQIQLNLARLEAEFATIKQRYLPKHPRYIQADSELADWQRSLTEAILAAPRTIESSLKSARAAEQALEKALHEQEDLALDLSKQQVAYNVLAREVESDRALYESVVNRLKETSLTKELRASPIRVVQPAVVPERPIKPEKTKLITRGLLAGLFGGILLAFALNQIDSSLKTVDQAEELLSLPVLTVVPQIRRLKANGQTLIVGEETADVGAESIRTLRTALSLLGRTESRKTFLFTSALPAEGKTFCTVNYALSLAQQGHRTLVVDCDLRRPMIERIFRTKQQAPNPGVSDYLTGQQDFKSVLLPTTHEKLFYIPAGTKCPNATELLGTTGLDGLIDEALKQFDRVVVDSAPIHAVSDTLLILNRIQTVCLVIRAWKTPRHSVRRAVQLLQEISAPVGGIILNSFPRRSGSGYYYDYYYRGNYYQNKP